MLQFLSVQHLFYFISHETATLDEAHTLGCIKVPEEAVQNANLWCFSRTKIC